MGLEFCATARRHLTCGVAVAALLTTTSAAQAQTSATTYAYDALGRLISATDASGSQVSYNYDAAGNRTKVSGQRFLQAIDFNFTVPPGQAKTFAPITNPAGGLHVVNVTAPSHGASVLNGDGTVTYTPTPGYAGLDDFTYAIADNAGASGVGHVHMIMNTAPTASAYSFLTQMGAAYSFDVLAGANPLARDPDGQALTVTASTPPHGSTSVAGGRITYTPAPGYGGVDNFTYTVVDPFGLTASNTVTATINRPPVANNYSVSTSHTKPITFDPKINDSDPDGDALTISAVGAASHGNVINSGTSVTYQPTGNFIGSDSFNYTISDGRGGFASAIATVNLTNSAPVANADNVIAQQATPLTFDPRSNDSDPDGDPISIIGTTNGAHGTTSFNGTTVTYSPYSGAHGWDGYYGWDTFTYTISDGYGGVSSATVSVLVNRPPQANYEMKQTMQDTPVTYDPRTNDSDPDGDPLTVVAVTSPQHGTISFTGGSITYTPALGFIGVDRFMYTITDGKGGYASILDEVNVAGALNHPPVANNDEYYMNYQYSPITLWVLQNDYDPDSDPIQIISVTYNGGGHPTIVNNGSAVQLDVVPQGTTSFSYTISDGRGGISSAWVTVTGLIPDGSGGGLEP